MRRVPWVAEEKDHASNIVLAVLALKEAYPHLRLGEPCRLARATLQRLRTFVPTDFLDDAAPSSDDDAGPIRAITVGAVTWQRFLPNWEPPEAD